MSRLEDLANRLEGDMKALVAQYNKVVPSDPPPPAPSVEDKDKLKQLIEACKGDIKAIEGELEAQEKSFQTASGASASSSGVHTEGSAKTGSHK